MNALKYVITTAVLISIIGFVGLILRDNANLRNQLEVTELECVSSRIGDLAAVMIVNGGIVCVHSYYVPLKSTWQRYREERRRNNDQCFRAPGLCQKSLLSVKGE